MCRGGVVVVVVGMLLRYCGERALGTILIFQHDSFSPKKEYIKLPVRRPWLLVLENLSLINYGPANLQPVLLQNSEFNVFILSVENQFFLCVLEMTDIIVSLLRQLLPNYPSFCMQCAHSIE